MTPFLDRLLRGTEIQPDGVYGYTEEELRKMESFYGIKIRGQLRQFFLEIGRCSGEISFNAFLFPYMGYHSQKTPAGISGHYQSQTDFRSLLMRNARPFGKGSPFLFSMEHETLYFFLRTKADEPLRGVTPEDDYSQLSDDPDIVYCFDENTSMAKITEYSLIEYLSSRAERSKSEVIGSGEMINF